MTRVAKPMLGAKGADHKNSPFLLDPSRSQEAENLRVRKQSRKRRPGKTRVLHTKHSSNALRFDGVDQHVYAIAIDRTNTDFNIFDTEGTVEFRIRLPEPLGFNGLNPIYVVSRPIFVSGALRYNFFIALTQTVVQTSATETYDITFGFHEAGGTLRSFVTTEVTSQISVGGGWYDVRIRRDSASLTSITFSVNGVDEAVVVSGATSSSIQGAFDDGEEAQNHGNVVIGAFHDMTIGCTFDFDELRIWSDNRTATQVNVDLSTADVEDSALLLYLNFQEITGTEYQIVNKANTSTPVFLGASMPYYDADNKAMVYAGNYSLGKLSAYGSSGGDKVGLALNSPLHKTTEIAIIPLKAKKGYILACGASNSRIFIQLDDDGSGGMVVKVGLDNGGAVVITGSVVLTAAAFDGSTPLYIGVVEDLPTETMTVYVNGSSAGTSAHGSGLVGCSSTTIGAADDGTLFLPMKLLWLRVWADTKPSSYMTTMYNVETEDLSAVIYHHFIANITYLSAGSNASAVGIGTAWSVRFTAEASVFAYHFNTFLGGGTNSRLIIGHSQLEPVTSISSPTALVIGGAPDRDGRVVNGAIIAERTDVFLSTLVVSYDDRSFRKQFRSEQAQPYWKVQSHLVASDIDATALPEICLTVRVNSTIPAVPGIFRQGHPSFIGGTVKIGVPNRVRFLGEIRDRDGLVDLIVMITGTALVTIHKTTQEVIHYPVNIYPNNDAQFSYAYLDRGLYLTDGKTKLHMYAINGRVEARRWGWSDITLGDRDPTYLDGTSTDATADSYVGDEQFRYKYGFYNRHLDQYSGIVGGPEYSPTLHSPAINVDSIRVNITHTAENEFETGATDLVIYRTKDLNNVGVDGEYYVLDYLPIRSLGYADFSGDNDNKLGVLFPPERLGIDVSPPDASVVVEHENRLWLFGGEARDKLYFSTIDSRLHVGKPKSETYVWLPDDFFELPGQRNLTAGISFSGFLWLFTVESVFVLAGQSKQSFTTRKLFEGIGCVSQQALLNVGGSIVWLGLDDIYTSSGGPPQRIDPEGKIRELIARDADPDKMDEAFAIHNLEEQTLEFHLIETIGPVGYPFTIIIDLTSGEYVIDTDVWATAAANILESDFRSVVYYGHSYGFLSKFDASVYTEYAPPSGSVRTNVSSFNLPTTTITVDASDLYVTDGGLVGCTVYIINQSGTISNGHIQKALIVSNTATTITLGVGKFCFGQSVWQATDGDIVIIASPLFRFKTAILADSAQEEDQQGQIRARQLVHTEWFHKTTEADGQGSYILRREEDTEGTGEVVKTIPHLDKIRSLVQHIGASRAQWYDLDVSFLHEDADFELIGFILVEDITRDAHLDEVPRT